MNTYNLPARPLYTLASLTLHECTPGHSFQAALALEGPERPPFRSGTSFSGYGEGWGLYTEWLGTVMGIYETPYEDFGRLTYEMWRACRLVIDTGIHQFGWTPRAGDGLPARPRGALRARDHDRGRALHRMAGAGARLQARRTADPPASSRGGREAGRRSSISGPSTTRSSRSARFRCRCWSSGWRSSSPTAANEPAYFVPTSERHDPLDGGDERRRRKWLGQERPAPAAGRDARHVVAVAGDEHHPQIGTLSSPGVRRAPGRASRA